MSTLFHVVASLALVLAVDQEPRAARPPEAPPATEVYVASLSVKGNTVTIGKPENISNSPGYDNQPFFAPDGRSLFFTSGRGADGRAPQTDIFRYDLAAGSVSQVISTPESEYSPTVTPDGRHLSVVRVEADQTQRLWRFGIEGQRPELVLKDVKPVGYHAWLDEHTVALFVLGQPPTLQVADTRSGKAEVVARDIGQSIQRIPRGGISFVQQAGEGSSRAFTIVQLTIEKGKPVTKPLVEAVAGATQAHVTWTPGGTLLMAHRDALYAWTPGDTTWRVIADSTALGLTGVTRLAVSPGGDRIAIVASK